MAFFDTVTYSDFRAHLATYLDKVVDDCMPMRITRKNGKRVVVIPEDYFSSWDETEYLMASEANRKNLEEALAEDPTTRNKYNSVDEICEKFGIKP